MQYIFNSLAIANLLQLFLITSLLAQNINITPAQREIEKLNRPGYISCIELDRKTVNKLWQKKLKSLGKVVTPKNGIAIAQEAELPQLSSSPVQIFSSIEPSSKCTNLFVSMVVDGSTVDLQNPKSQQVKQFLHDFTLEAYRADLGEQITEAEKAVAKAVKLHEKTLKEGQNIDRMIEKNASEKIKLEKQLKDNEKEKSELEKRKAKNIVEQESALEEIKKVRKIAEEKKAKLDAIR